MSLTYTLDPGGSNELTLDSSEIVSQNPVRVHTGLSDLNATLVENRDLDDYAQRQDRLNVSVDGTVKWTGYLVGINHNTGRGTSRIRADGITKRLKETRPDYASLGGSLTYSSISLEDALRDYWARTPFSNYSVTPQSTETVATRQTVQSANSTTDFEAETSIADTEPIVIDSGELRLAQSAFFGVTDDLDGGTNQVTDPNLTDENWDNADVWEYDQSGDESLPVQLSVNPNYTIPSEHVGIMVRVEGDFTNGISATVNGDLVYENTAFDAGTDVGWFALASDTSNLSGTFSDLPGDEYDGADLTPGTNYIFEFGPNGDPSGGLSTAYIDCLVLYDDRFSYSVDNTIGSGSLSLTGPQEYPESYPVEFANKLVSFNIQEAQLDIEIDDTSNNQSIGISFDGGGTYTTATNSTTLTTQPNTPTRELRGRVTLSRYTTDTDNSPTTGDTGQKLDASTAPIAFLLEVDGDDLVVINELELSRNHFENLQQLHDYGGDWNWTIEHDDSSIANMTVTSYQVGDETRTKPSSFADPISESAEVQAEAYFNSIYLQGSLDSQGDRPVAELKDSTAISNDGREISPGVLRDPKVTTEAGATFRARALLDTATSNNELVGDKVVPTDTLIEPGYQYPVDFGNGDNEKTLEEVSLTESGDRVSLRARFSTPRSDLSRQIEDLQRESRSIGDKV